MAANKTEINFEYLRYAIEASLMTKILARELGFETDKEKGAIPVLSQKLSQFAGKSIYLQSGHAAYGGAIKGHAALGYYWQYMAPEYRELKELEEKAADGNKEAKFKLKMERVSYSQGHGRETFDKDTLSEIPILHIALWKAFKNRPMIAPSSGSFALSFVETLNKLRELQILGPNEGGVHLWVPEADEGKITDEKFIAISKLAANTPGCKIFNWKESKSRDYDAFLDSLGFDENGKETSNPVPGYFCATNALSKDQFHDIFIQPAVHFLGWAKFNYEASSSPNSRNYAELRLDSLSKMKVDIVRNAQGLETLEAKFPMAGSAFGLMLAKLDEMEELLQNPDLKLEETFNQSSAGSTLSALAMVNIALSKPNMIFVDELDNDDLAKMLKEMFPNIYSKIIVPVMKGEQPAILSKLHGCFDPGYDILAKNLGYNGINYPTDSSVNGLTASSQSDEVTSWLKAAKSEEGGATFTGMEVCPHNLMEIARCMIFIANIEKDGKKALYPESAGAASLGTWLHNQVISGNITGGEVARFLRENGIDLDMFEELMNCETNGFAYVDDEARKHGGKMLEFHQQFMDGMTKKNIDLLPKKSVFIDATKCCVLFVTGCNGTEKQQAMANDIKDIVDNQSKGKGHSQDIGQGGSNISVQYTTTYPRHKTDKKRLSGSDPSPVSPAHMKAGSISHGEDSPSYVKSLISPDPQPRRSPPVACRT